jgi:hypothetical protein
MSFITQPVVLAEPTGPRIPHTGAVSFRMNCSIVADGV